MIPAWGLAVVAAVATTASQPGATRAFRYLMGTSVSVEAVGGDEAARAAAIEEAFAAVAEVDRLMSNYRNDSELARVNRRAALEPVTVGDALLSVLLAAQDVSRKSAGAFDVTVGPLVKLWGFHDKRPHVPSADELAAVRPLVDFRNLALDSTTRSVRFAREGVEIDLGGIAKGFAVELAAASLRSRGLAGMIDAGGNQHFVGRPLGKPSWSVGIQDPDAPGRLLGVLDVPEGGLSTSALYANFLTASGRRYGHILDPRSLMPCETSLSATVVSPDGTLADALSKVVFVLGAERGLEIVEGFPGAAAVVAFRKPDGSVGVSVSPALRKSLRLTP